MLDRLKWERRPDWALELMRERVQELEEGCCEDEDEEFYLGDDYDAKEDLRWDIEVEIEDADEQNEALLRYEMQNGELPDHERKSLGIKGKQLTRYKALVEQYRDRNGVLNPDETMFPFCLDEFAIKDEGNNVSYRQGCPDCGNMLTFPNNAAMVRCQFCGSTVHVN